MESDTSPDARGARSVIHGFDGGAARLPDARQMALTARSRLSRLTRPRPGPQALEALLLARGVITAADLADAREARRSLDLPLGDILLARGALRKLRKRVDPRRYNGAVFLGLNGITVKSHGGTDPFGFAHAIGVAVDLARHGFMDTIKSDFEALAKAPVTTPQAAAI